MSRSRQSTGKSTAIDANLAQRLVPGRPEGAHKWSVGGVLIVGGSPGFIGAPAMAGLAAGRSGAGVVSIASPRSAIGAMATIIPEATFLPLPEGDLGAGGERAAARIRESLDRYRALVVGPGLGEDEYANSVMQGLTGAAVVARAAGSLGFSASRPANPKLPASEETSILGGAIPAVIDADGLNWLSGQDGWADRFSQGSLVLTPHAREMARLTGLDIDEIRANPGEVAARYASEWRQIIVLKGTPTIVSDGEATRVASSSPTALATAGSGDVLAGSIGAFLAQGLAPLDAATLAVFLGITAAEQLTTRFSSLGVIATDLPVAIAEALAALAS